MFFTLRARKVQLRPEDFLDVSLRDVERPLLRDRERVRLRSRYGSVALPFKINDGARDGDLRHRPHARSLSNLVTTSERDDVTGTPEYKRIAVQVANLS